MKTNSRIIKQSLTGIPGGKSDTLNKENRLPLDDLVRSMTDELHRAFGGELSNGNVVLQGVLEGIDPDRACDFLLQLFARYAYAVTIIRTPVERMQEA